MEQNIRVTVDAIIMARKEDKDHILLVQRKNEPFKGKWAFPGGFVDDEEDLSIAAKRELQEETSIEVDDLEQFKAVGTPGRDPRGRTVTIVYYGCLHEDKMMAAIGGDDAAKAEWFAINNLPPLAFDHKEIIEDFKRFVKK